MATLNYYFVLRQLTCQDAVNGMYQAKWYIMNRATIATSTAFWHEGMSNGTALTAAPADADIPLMEIHGKTVDELAECVRDKCQSLATRLTAKDVTPIAVAAGTIVPVTIVTN